MEGEEDLINGAEDRGFLDAAVVGGKSLGRDFECTEGGGNWGELELS